MKAVGSMTVQATLEIGQVGGVQGPSGPVMKTPETVELSRSRKKIRGPSGSEKKKVPNKEDKDTV